MRTRARYHHLRVAFFLLGSLASGTGPARAQDPYLGEIDLVPYNFAMKGFADCNGQLLPIAQNTALFSLLGTTYGGDGKTTFALPDLRDRVPIHAGQGPGLSEYVQGAMGGEFTHILTIAEMPGHTHAFGASGTDGTSSSPGNGVMARNAGGFPSYAATQNITMSTGTIGATGGGQPHNNLQPYLGLKYVIALQGIYPPRP